MKVRMNTVMKSVVAKIRAGLFCRPAAAALVMFCGSWGAGGCSAPSTPAATPGQTRVAAFPKAKDFLARVEALPPNQRGAFIAAHPTDERTVMQTGDLILTTRLENAKAGR